MKSIWNEKKDTSSQEWLKEALIHSLSVIKPPTIFNKLFSLIQY